MQRKASANNASDLAREIIPPEYQVHSNRKARSGFCLRAKLN